MPEANPVGVYRRDIDIPADWDGRDIYLHLAGAKSGVYIYINGQEVGYSEDSKNSAEFLINKFVKPGKNVLTQVLIWNVRTSGVSAVSNAMYSFTHNPKPRSKISV